MPKENKQDDETVKAVPYTEAEKDYRNLLTKRIENAREQRDLEHDEFNGMTYLENYENNCKIGNSYVPPKENKEDTRIAAGTVEEKVNSFQNVLINYNLEPNVAAFDTNNIVHTDLSMAMEGMVKKSRLIEMYDEARPLIYKELLDQGTVFVEELFIKKREIKKKLKDNLVFDGMKLKDIKWDERIEEAYGECAVNLLSGTGVYLGSMKTFSLKKQPYAFTAEIEPLANIEQMFGKWERWKYVPKKFEAWKDITNADGIQYRDWTLSASLKEGWGEIIRYQDPIKNELMIMINGVMMLPVGFPLTAISPDGGFTFTKGDISPISNFFPYSRSVPMKARVHEEVLNEFIRAMILKTQKSFAPPYANNSKRAVSRNIYLPGKITNNIKPDQLQEIGENKGVTQSEFQMYEFMKKEIAEKSVSSQFQGGEQRAKTATQTIEDKKQNMLKMGMTVFGVVLLETKMTYKRIYNILENWTQPIDNKVNETKDSLKAVFRNMSVEKDFEDGQSGNLVVKFDENNVQTDQEIFEEEEQLREQTGKETRIISINPKILKQIKYNWYVTITPTEKQTSELRRQLFVENIADAAEIFGIESLNLEGLKPRFAAIIGEDKDTFFAPGVPAQAGFNEQVSRGAGGQVTAAGINRPQSPSINKLAQE